MIQFVLLVVLGFLIASLIALLLAPSLWRRAERLTTRRLEQTMPMSIADIEADRDQLRASYAIMIRRIEAALNLEKMRSARQRVQISRLQMEIADLRESTARLRAALEGERNVASVLQQTIAKRVPELDRAVSDARALLRVRDREIASLANRLMRREEALAIAQRTMELQQAEIARLRQSMEMSGVRASGRFKKRPSQWTIHDYRAEYDRLNVELSKLRERLSVAYDREVQQITGLRSELQRLADRIIAAASTPAPAPSPLSAPSGSETAQIPPPETRQEAEPLPVAERPVAAMLAAQRHKAERQDAHAARERLPGNGTRAGKKAVVRPLSHAAQAVAARLAPARLAERAANAVVSLAASIPKSVQSGRAGSSDAEAAETSKAKREPTLTPATTPAADSGQDTGKATQRQEVSANHAADVREDAEDVKQRLEVPAEDGPAPVSAAAEAPPDTADLYRSAKSSAVARSREAWQGDGDREADAEPPPASVENLLPASEPRTDDARSDKEIGAASASLLDRLRRAPERQSG